MTVIEILPELDIGGVERHVIDLANELTARGHEVTVISAGGKMQSQLSERVRHIDMPVHKKNPFTIWACSRKIAELARMDKVQLIHAHSRVPAWIARWAAKGAGVPYVVTAHVVFGNKSPWIYAPYRDAARVICVSNAVREGMKDCFYANTQVVLNGLDEPKVRWNKKNLEGPVKFLFVGRLSPVKGLHDALRAMPEDMEWTMDVLGDGPMREELETITKERGFTERVKFHGYSDKADDFMARSSCLLFPSYTEGMPLTLARAVQIGIPVIASDIPPVSEMAGTSDNLLPAGDIPAWREAIADFIKTRLAKVTIPLSSVPTLAKMVDADEQIYGEVTGKFAEGVK
ncbi:glycosyltransferase family 4 protein [uncultured Cloacibacillus sp.]|uniref:glycosyltransferase family 4 protein n=1 Tax=uncultured Cloacibacillus sp. TaxID=889794 RepID=UPI002615FA38|nr:glycosyltransferase family 4 protein [uncultured Cloacibacillus sp.]